MNVYEDKEEDLTDEQLSILDWLAYSLANEEKRAVLKIMASVKFDTSLKSQTVANEIGLDTDVITLIAQNLASLGILKRNTVTGTGSGHFWQFKDEKFYNLVRRIEHIKEVINLVNEIDADE